MNLYKIWVSLSEMSDKKIDLVCDIIIIIIIIIYYSSRQLT